MDVSWGSRSVRARGSTTNEDALKVWFDQPVVRRAGRGTLFAVADGEGPVGRQVAWAVLDALDLFFEIPSADFTPGSGLRAALGAAHEAARSVVLQDHGGTSGCTLSMVYVTPAIDRALLVAVGDTAAWVQHRGRLHALVRPTSDQRDTAGSRLGLAYPSAFNRPIKLSLGDVIVIATRGVSTVVREDTLADLMDLPLHPTDLAADLVGIASAQTRGGQHASPFDATALAIRFGPCPVIRGGDDLA